MLYEKIMNEVRRFEMESTPGYPTYWARAEVRLDELNLMTNSPAAGSRCWDIWIQRVRDLPPGVYHISAAGVYVFDVRGELVYCSLKKPDPNWLAMGLRAARATFSVGRRTVARGMTIARIQCDAFGNQVAATPTASDAEFESRLAAMELGRSTAKSIVRDTAPELIDGLTAIECYEAFCASQRDRRVFELVLPPARVRVGDQVHVAGPAGFDAAAQPDAMFAAALGVSADGRVRVESGTLQHWRYLVRRPIDLTPAQVETAKAIWRADLRRRVAATTAADTARAPSVVTTDFDAEIEALCADVRS